VGTLLLQIGEVGQKFGKRIPAPAEVEEEVTQSVGDDEQKVDLDVEEKLCKNKKIDGNWSITFEQFLASILTEPALVEHFSERSDLLEALREYSSCSVRKQPSTETQDYSRSVFYV
jgi:hypothetical protein